MRKWLMLITMMLLVQSVSASETRLVIEAGDYQHLSNSHPGGRALFRLVSAETPTIRDDVYGVLSLGEWIRDDNLGSEAAFVIMGLAYNPRVKAGWGIRLGGGLAVLDQTTERLSTHYQFHLSAHVTLDFGLIGFRYGCHHFSNGNKIHGIGRSEINHAEEFCGVGISGRF